MKGLIVALALVSLGGVQVPAPEVAALSADERLMVESVLLLKKQAAKACADLVVMKDYLVLQAKVETRLKQAHPAQTFDWNAGQLVAK